MKNLKKKNLKMRLKKKCFRKSNKITLNRNKILIKLQLMENHIIKEINLSTLKQMNYLKKLMNYKQRMMSYKNKMISYINK